MTASDVLVRLQTEDQEAMRVRVTLPARIGRRPDLALRVDDPMVSGLHAVIERTEAGLQVRDLDSANGLWVGERRVSACPLEPGVTVRVGHTTLSLEDPVAASSGVAPTVWVTDLGFSAEGEVAPASTGPSEDPEFPPPCFAKRQVSLDALAATGLPVLESRYLALGGGVGSFCWADALRVHGVPADQIRVVGFEAVPYARYKRLCRNSQIPDHERLRSNSESTPDNLWGFPGYGAREAWTALWRLEPLRAAQTLWTLFAEPDHAATYTPRAGQVFDAIDAEAKRIGWSDMLEPGRVRGLRQTTDGRYVVAVSSRHDPAGPRAFYVAPTVHVALGYPGLQFLPDLRDYRERTGDFVRVVNAYEDHDRVYEHLEAHGGTVVLRGRGIVASRVLQRLHETRQRGSNIRVIHLMRSQNRAGHQSGQARRRVDNHWEFQPFNWPEACWGGDLKGRLAQAVPEERQRLLGEWGGTTTADREDWKRIVRQGLRRGWYRILFGSMIALDGDEQALRMKVRTLDGPEATETADFVIDATGLVSDVRANPVLGDLIETYQLALNPADRVSVDERFEVTGLRNGPGRVFLAGVATLGGPYAPVDSFLGLQHAALASLGALSPGVRALGPVRSVSAWWRWARGSRP